MTSLVHFETPENVQIDYRTSGLGTRFCAWLLDLLLVIVVAILLVLGSVLVGAAVTKAFDSALGKLGVRRTGSPEELNLYIAAVVWVALQLGSLVYFTLSELLVRGQTIGKRACGLRVVRVNGFALEAGSVLIRNILRVIDQIPPLWLVPLLSVRSQRLGDMVAGTIVVAETQDRIGELRAKLQARDAQDARFRFDAAMLNRTQPTDVEALERILERWPSLTENQRTLLLDRMVEPLAKRLSAPSPDRADRHEFLVELLSAIYRRESRRLG
jgi:uncharacterized RDD family membrane protein YckC